MVRRAVTLIEDNESGDIEDLEEAVG